MYILSLSFIQTVLDSIVSFGSFTTLHKLLGRFNNSNMSNNFTALTHATGSSILGFTYLLSNNSNIYYFLKIFSTGYFLYDIKYILKRGKFNQLSLAYLYHHMASIYIINRNPEIYKGGHILFWGELSNIPSYFVYYLMKQTHNPKITKQLLWLKKIQFLMYAGIRVPVLGYIATKTLLTTNDKIGFFPVMPVYLMGTIWTYKMYKSLK